jgi:uncharacterized protein YndB with AHSA1/START domain
MSHISGTAWDDFDADDVFRALADPSRRRILDLLKEDPGMNLTRLSEQFEFSRFAVMKHLKTLERANLVVSRRAGRERQLYVNGVPLQGIYDRWISQYGAVLARRITSLKWDLEQEMGSMTTTATKLQHLYVTYIRTTPERIWEALTDPAQTKMFFHDTEVKSDFEVGAPIEYLLTEEDGSKRAALTGEILEIDPGRKLVHSFAFASNDDPPSRVTWEIEPLGDVVKLTVLHDEFESETETFTSVAHGWPPIFSGLKTLLETGEALRIPGPARESA